MKEEHSRVAILVMFAVLIAVLFFKLPGVVPQVSMDPLPVAIEIDPKCHPARQPDPIEDLEGWSEWIDDCIPRSTPTEPGSGLPEPPRCTAQPTTYLTDDGKCWDLRGDCEIVRNHSCDLPPFSNLPGLPIPG